MYVCTKVRVFNGRVYMKIVLQMCKYRFQRFQQIGWVGWYLVYILFVVIPYIPYIPGYRDITLLLYLVFYWVFHIVYSILLDIGYWIDIQYKYCDTAADHKYIITSIY